MSKKEEDLWAKVKADFVAGLLDLRAIAKKHGVSIAAILTRAQKETWPPRGSPPPSAVTTLVVREAPKSRTEQVEDRVDEAAQDIIREHRDRTRALRDTYDTLQGEFQAMMANLLSFLDEQQIAKLRQATDPTAGIALLTNMLKATGIKFSLFERLATMLAGIIDMERKVWGLEATDGAPESVQWDDLLAKTRVPARPRPLPAKILAFDRQMTVHK